MEDQRNEFAPYPLPPQEGNMNGWLPDDANDSDLESTTCNQPMIMTMEDTVTGVKIVVAKDVTAEKPKRPRKKRQAITDASGLSYPPKKLRGDYEASGEVATIGKSPSALRELLASSMLYVEAGVAAVVTLPMVTSSVFATPEHKSCAPANSITGANLRTIGASEKFVISSDSSHHSGTNASGAKDDSIIRSDVVPSVMTEAVVTSHAITVSSVLKTEAKVTFPVHASLFQDSNSTKTVKEDVTCPFYSAGPDLSMGSRELDAETLHQVFVSQWNIRKMDYHHLFTEFNVGTARQACLNAKVKMRTEYCLCERKRLEFECEKQADLLKARDEEIEKLKAHLLLKEIEAAEATHLQLQYSVSTKDLELKDLNVTVSSLRSQNDGLVDQVAKLDADFLEMALHLEEKFYPHLLTTISGRRWLLTHGLKLAIVKCLNSHGYLLALGAAIIRAIEKGIRDGLSDGIDHGKAGRSLADVVAYNLVVEADYNFDLQRLREPNVDQLMLLVHRTEDQVVLSETSLSFALSVTHSKVERIRENVAAKRSTLIGVWTPLVDPLSVENLVGESGTSDGVPTIIATTTALLTTFASASSVPPITIEDYEIVGTNGPEDA
nr:hypothetical protein [Tanacetum cinerariifolium]